MNIRCGECSGLRENLCATQLRIASEGIEEGARETAAGNWVSWSTGPDGNVPTTHVDGFSPEAIEAQLIVRQRLVRCHQMLQAAIGCTLTEEEIEQQLNLEIPGQM